MVSLLINPFMMSVFLLFIFDCFLPFFHCSSLVIISCSASLFPLRLFPLFCYLQRAREKAERRVDADHARIAEMDRGRGKGCGVLHVACGRSALVSRSYPRCLTRRNPFAEHEGIIESCSQSVCSTSIKALNHAGERDKERMKETEHKRKHKHDEKRGSQTVLKRC